jgi:lysophospholipase L1-like esterase
MSRLRTAYQGPCIQVQRTSDDVLKVIPFAGEDLDALALTAHGASTLRTWYDQGTTGTNVVQTTENRQAALLRDGVVEKYFAYGNGTTTGMETAGTVDLSGATAATVICVVRHMRAFGVVIEQLATQGWSIYSFLSTDTIGAQFNGSASSLIQCRSEQQIAQQATYCVAMILEPGAATNDEKVRLDLNGVAQDETQTLVVGSVDTAGFINAKIQLFARSLTDFPTNSGIHTAMVFKGKLTEAELTKIVNWSRRISTSYADIPSKWDDSRNTFDQTGVISCSPYATASYNTRATRVGVWTQHAYPENDQKRIGVYIDDDYYTDALLNDEEDSGRVEVVLPAGQKKVTVVGGIANWPGAGRITGIYPQGVEFNSPISRVAEVNTNRLTILGDSISVGASAAVLQREAWAMQLRLYGVIPVSVDGYGYRSMYEESVDATARTASVARLLEHNPTNIWIALGTNDWGRGDWDAGDFQTAYSALLVAINAALPSATIYCQTPVRFLDEVTTNDFDEVPQDYRDAVIAATTGKAYATAVNWASLLLAGDLADNVHPNTSGHTKMFNAAKTVLGI